MQGWYSQGRYILTKDGTYSTNERYLSIVGQRPKMETTKLVWISMALPKHRFVVWLAMQGRLLTQERLIRLHIQGDDTSYYLCDAKVLETNAHLFVDCTWII